jgi:glycosyltransferase involved in cell wall biosynthesis
MIHELFSRDIPKGGAYERRFVAEKKACLERASSLIAISESTARDIVSCYPHIDARKIVIAPLGVDEFFFQVAKWPIDERSKPYLLYVGHRSVYKNFLRLLSAYGQSGFSSEVDLRVISSEGQGFSLAEQEQIQMYGLRSSVHLLGSVTEEELREQYAKSLALVYPSTYEGFGLPILEAMASGTLVATSNVSSMPEVGGEVAFYFDPLNVESIANTLQEVIQLPSVQRSARVAAGIDRAHCFSWSRCQRAVIDVFQHLL